MKGNDKLDAGFAERECVGVQNCVQEANQDSLSWLTIIMICRANSSELGFLD